MSSTLKVDILQDSGGNNIIASDGSGNLTTQKINYPAFEAYLSSDQTLSDAVNTKVQFDTEVLDTDGYYDNTTNYRFTPLVAGNYCVYSILKTQSGSNGEFRNSSLSIYKNGVAYASNSDVVQIDGRTVATLTHITTVDMNGSTDYIEIFGLVNVDTGTPRIDAGLKSSLFGAYRIGD